MLRFREEFGVKVQSLLLEFFSFAKSLALEGDAVDGLLLEFLITIDHDLLYEARLRVYLVEIDSSLPRRN